MKNQKNLWIEENKQYLMSELESVKCKIKKNYSALESGLDNKNLHYEYSKESFALEHLTRIFNLTSFERDLLLFCTGVELDDQFSEFCIENSGNRSLSQPTFSLALKLFPDGHWNAFTPDAPLRYWRLVETDNEPTRINSPIKIDEHVLNYLLGIQHIDVRLSDYLNLLSVQNKFLSASQITFCEHISQFIKKFNHQHSLPFVQLTGKKSNITNFAAATVCEKLGMQLYELSAWLLPADIHETTALCRLINREFFLSGVALILDCSQLSPSDNIMKSVERFLDIYSGLLFINSENQLAMTRRFSAVFEIQKPLLSEQVSFWNKTLASSPYTRNGTVESITNYFNLDLSTIHSIGLNLMKKADLDDKTKSDPKELWDVCRTYVRPQINYLAQHIKSNVQWEDIVLPDREKQILKGIAAHLKYKNRVYDNWGFAEKGNRGLGISALFAGVSGTGKTMAAEVLSNELNLDLFKIDLSSVVSKYIGETEKNLKKVFDAAEESSAILFFDEADALFGKRSEVKDSHDRYANIEVSYLLQRMESYNGLAILATNRKNAIDSAFLRRIRFIINFPFPDNTHRLEIWKNIFPKETPLNYINYDKLSRLNIAGGNIRNIAVNAAFFAAEKNEPVNMNDLLKATESEYSKIEKSLTDSERHGWI